jgi:DNA-binding NarL/FixJ family response regulator
MIVDACNVILVDDHPLTRAGIKSVLEKHRGLRGIVRDEQPQRGSGCRVKK